MGGCGVSFKETAGRLFTMCKGGGRQAGWLHRMRGRALDARGMALITALFIVFVLGMMLFAFVFMMQSEAGFAGLSRNSTVSLGLAEAGLQEAVKRLAMFGRGPLASSFSNSLANSAQAPGSTGTVTFQSALQGNPQLFPVTSTATFGGTTRTVRLVEQMISKPGDGNIVFGPQVTFGGDAHQITGDSYAVTFISYQQFQKAPQCSTGASATNLLSPQVFAGTYVGAGSGPNLTTPCGDTNAGTRYDTECALGSASNEVAPTPCPGGRQTAGGYTLPQNWHPNVPIGMSSADFTTAAVWINQYPGQALSYGLSLAHAQQNALDVSYTPAGTYTPSYWSGAGSIPLSANKVLLIKAQLSFCVAAPGNPAKDVKPGSTPCPAGYNPPANPYGPNAPGSADRYLDWGLVQDDLTRPVPQTFFQAPSCTAPCPNPGNQNGVRYIPNVPQIDVLGRACQQNVNPGLNVFDKLGAFTCPAGSPVTTISTTSVTFQGTYPPASPGPESLIIDDFGVSGGVSITPSIAGPGTCSSDFTLYNYGVILATGDLHFTGNTVFSGFVYTNGNIYTAGTTVFNGGLYAYSINPGVDQVDALGNFSQCAGSAAALPGSPLFYNFKVISWTDVPANQP